jgi:hypothetical protein
MLAPACLGYIIKKNIFFLCGLCFFVALREILNIVLIILLPIYIEQGNNKNYFE